MKNDLTKGSVLRQLLLFAVPIFGANLLQAMYGTVDLLIVGRFSDAVSVSAVATGSSVMMTVSTVIIGLTMGTTVLLGQYVGMKNDKGAARTVASSLMLFVCVGVVLTFLVILFAAPVAKLMNAPEQAFSETVSYIKICGAGVIFIVLFNALGGMFRGIGDSRTPLILMLIACVSNILGDLVLVGVLDMKGSGAAIATVGAQGISVISAFFIIKKRGFGFDTDKNELRPTLRETGLILKYGTPIAAQELLTGLSFMVIQSILNKFGLVASAGVGVAEKICGLMFIVPGAMMSGVSAFAAQNVGAGLRDRAKKSMFIGMALTLTTGVCMFALSFFCGEALGSIFSKEPPVVAACADYLKSYGIDCLIVGVNFSMMGYLNGNGKTTFVALQGILSTFLVRIPVSYFMSKVPGVTLFEIGFATPLATIFAILMTTVYLIQFEKKNASLKGESI